MYVNVKTNRTKQTMDYLFKLILIYIILKDRKKMLTQKKLINERISSRQPPEQLRSKRFHGCHLSHFFIK